MGRIAISLIRMFQSSQVTLSHKSTGLQSMFNCSTGSVQWVISSVFLGNLRAVESNRFPASKSKWWLEDFWMMMMMMIVVVVVMMIMTRFQTCDYTRILGDAPFNFCCTFGFFFVMMIFGNCRFQQGRRANEKFEKPWVHMEMIMLSKWFPMIFQENHGLLWVLSPKAGGFPGISQGVQSLFPRLQPLLTPKVRNPADKKLLSFISIESLISSASEQQRRLFEFLKGQPLFLVSSYLWHVTVI